MQTRARREAVRRTGARARRRPRSQLKLPLCAVGETCHGYTRQRRAQTGSVLGRGRSTRQPAGFDPARREHQPCGRSDPPVSSSCGLVASLGRAVGGFSADQNQGGKHADNCIRRPDAARQDRHRSRGRGFLREPGAKGGARSVPKASGHCAGSQCRSRALRTATSRSWRSKRPTPDGSGNARNLGGALRSLVSRRRPRRPWHRPRRGFRAPGAGPRLPPIARAGTVGS